MGTGYVRNDTSNNIADGNVINASDLDGEFDAIVAAFNSSSGHTHDGTSEEGAPITKFGPSQEIEGDANALFPASDGVTDLGKSTKEFRDLYIDGVINTDNMSADAATITGNVSVGGTLNIGGAVDTESTMSVQSNASVGGTLAVTGDTDVSNLSASGTFDVGGNASVGGTLAVTGDSDVSNLSASGTLDVAGETSLGNVSADGTLDVSGNGSVGGTFNVEGDLKNSAGNLTVAATSYILEVKGGGSTEGQIQLNCAVNSHGQILKSQPHSEAVTNTMLLPKGANSTLVSEAGTATLTNKTFGTINVTGDSDLEDVSASGTFDVAGNASVGGTLKVTSNLTVETQSELRLEDSAGGQYVGIKAPAAVGSSVTFTFPSADGTNGQGLITDGSGNLSFGAAGVTTGKAIAMAIVFG